MAPGKKRADRAGAAGEPSELHTPQEPVNCVICDKDIVEASNSVTGNDALQCEGACGGWMHGCCAGVSLSHYASLSVSEEPFFCAIWCQRTMRETISSLRDTVSVLKLEIAPLKVEKSSLQCRKITLNESIDSVPGPVCTVQAHAPGPSTQHSRVNHKFKLVIRRVKEHPKETQ